jgi:hypothetical protein
MTKEEFNALPLEARRFIEKNAGCLACGSSESKLTKAYELYKNNKTMSAYQLFGGGINYNQENDRGVLVGIKPTDSPFEIKEKIRIAKLIYAVSPHVFISFDEKAIDELLGTLPENEVVDLTKGEGEGEGEGDTFNLATASYQELKDFVQDNNIVAKSQSKKDLIAAIEALELL